VASQIDPNQNILDIGCGAGFLTNFLAEKGHVVTGVDLSETSLDIARLHDQTHSVEYIKASAYHLPFEKTKFDIVCATDVLEHLEYPERLIQEASRVLRPGGYFFFHTFNRTLASYVIVIKGVDWFVRNAPKNMHVYSLFIKPKELEKMCYSNGFNIESLRGFRPKILTFLSVFLLLLKPVTVELRKKFALMLVMKKFNKKIKKMSLHINSVIL
jgi:2-polyprenyl-6-hydroxyphenyl methylase/3-demethylubiquinone-9 3-methyltransferase